MRFCSKFFKTILISLFLFASVVGVAAKDEWIKVRSKNFSLIGNASEKDIRGAAEKLEQFREVFRQIFPKMNFDSKVPINVVVFKDEKTFRDFKPLNDEGARRDYVTGYFQSGEDANYIVLSAESEKADTYRTIFHEYVHFLVNNEMGRTDIPPWFNEGLAEYYKMFEIQDDQKISFGAVNNKHLQMLQQNKLIPFDVFFNTDNYTLRRQGADGEGLFYAQAWALMHYLMRDSDGARSGQLSKFADLVLNGKTTREAFEEAFQINYAAMETELKNYISRKNFLVTNRILKNKLIFDREMRTSQIPESEAKAVLGDLLYHTNRLDEAAAMLEAVLKIDANSRIANASLGLVKMRQSKFSEAKKYLEKAVALDDKNYLVHYQYAYVLSREKMTGFGFVSGYNLEQAEKMRESLRRAIELNPNFAESYHLLAFVNIVRNEDIDEAQTYLEKALKLAPGNQWYQMRVAEIYLRREDFPNARRIAQKIYETAPDDNLRVYAKTTLNTINSYESQLKSLKDSNTRQYEEVTDQPLTDEELARLNEKALVEAINQNLRRLKADEKRVLGYLSKIECGANQINYLIKVENRILRLSSETFDSLKLTTFDAETADGQIGCGTIKKEMFAVVTYRPISKSRTTGEIVAIEFVPKNFKFLN